MPPTEQFEDTKRSTKKIKAMGSRRIEGDDIPYLFTLSRPSQLAGFLEKRGVSEPIHYLVCEDAIEGIMPQVLTQRGEIVPLTVGCLSEIQLVGTTRQSEFADGLPSMVAFTGNGYAALKRDVKVYLSGDSSGLLLGRPQTKLMNALFKSPERRQGAIRLVPKARAHTRRWRKTPPCRPRIGWSRPSSPRHDRSEATR